MRNLAVLVVVSTAALGCSSGVASAVPAPPPVAIRTVPVRHAPMQSTLHYVGTLGSRREVKVVARVAGTVEALPAAAGAGVEAGQVVARLAVPEHAALLRRLQAETRRAGTERAFLCRQYETDQRLAAQGALAGAQLDASLRACQGAQAAEAAVGAALAEGRQNAGKATERAPFAGRVLDHLAEPGQHVMPGQPVVLLGGDDLEVRVAVTEEDIRRGIRPGTPVRLGGEGAAVVTEVAAVAGRPARTIEVTIAADDPRFGDLTAGMSVDVAFVLDEEPNAAAVPRDALFRTDEGTFIWTVQDDRASRLEVRLGIADGRWVSVSPPPPPGARVALGDLRALRDGAPVYAVAAEGRAP